MLKHITQNNNNNKVEKKWNTRIKTVLARIMCMVYYSSYSMKFYLNPFNFYIVLFVRNGTTLELVP